MKYIANPVEVDAGVIVEVGVTQDDGTVWLTVRKMDDWIADSGFLADKGILARYYPAVGDYLVRQGDGYFYVNPKSVFERKYSPKESQNADSK